MKLMRIVVIYFNGVIVFKSKNDTPIPGDNNRPKIF